MRNSVLNGFVRTTRDHEGIVPWLYLDRLGLVTTAMGNLVEVMSDGKGTGRPTSNLFDQPWDNGSGSLASRAEIQQAFDTVKAAQELAHLGGGNQAFANLTRIRLGPPGTRVNEITPQISAFVFSVLHNFESIIAQGIPAFPQLNADAQMALLEHGWAVGPNMGGWPHLSAALNSNPPDYRTAQTEDHQGGVTADRARMTFDLWQNAIDVQARGADPDVLYYPGTVDNPGDQGGDSGGRLPPGAGIASLSGGLARGSPLLSTRGKIGLLLGGAGAAALAYNFRGYLK